MDAPLTPRQRIYLSARSVFNGPNAQVRKQRKVKELVQHHQHDLKALLEEYGEANLVDVIKGLLEERIFESVSRAKTVFPELFYPLQKEAEQETTELQAIESTENSVEDIQSGNEDTTLIEDAMVDHGTDPTVELLPTGPSIPSLYPLCIPYKTQHHLLTSAQRLMEECCFDFAEKWLPNVVQDHGWDCGAAVELTKWMDILTVDYVNEIPSHAIDLAKSQSKLKDLLRNTHELRNTAVHRVPTTAREISKLLHYSVQLAEAFQDQKRTSQLEGLKAAVDDKISAMELSKNFLETDTTTKVEALRRQKQELERQEHELIARMVEEDQENKELIGRLLMESIEGVLAPDASREESDMSDHAMTDSDESHEYHIEDKVPPPKRLAKSLALLLGYLPSRRWY